MFLKFLMPKVDLNKSSKNSKTSDFKRRKSTLGRGKHQHPTHTKIDVKTAQIKVLSQSKFENTEEVTNVPTFEQFSNLILLSHSDINKKVLQGIQGLKTVITKAPDLFVKNMTQVFNPLLRNIKHEDSSIRENSMNLVDYLFNRFGSDCSPLIPIFVKYNSVYAVSTNSMVKEQGALLLEKISNLPDVHPSPIFFDLFSKMVMNSNTPHDFSNSFRAIKKMIDRFSQRSNKKKNYYYTDKCVPILFNRTSTFSFRYNTSLILEFEVVELFKSFLEDLSKKLDQIRYAESNDISVEMCSLLISLHNLYSDVDFDKFYEFIGEDWPYEEMPLKKNIIPARFLATSDKYKDKVREFLKEVHLSEESVLLYILVSQGTDDLNSTTFSSEIIQDLYKIDISPQISSNVCFAVLKYLKEDDKPTKKAINLLYKLEKPEGFQDLLLDVLKIRLVNSSEFVQDMYLNLVAFSSPLNKDFIEKFSAYLCSLDYSDSNINNIIQNSIKKISLTYDKTDISLLLHLLQTMKKNVPSVGEVCNKMYDMLKARRGEEYEDIFKSISI